MKKELTIPALTVAAAATLLTGCASMNSGSSMSSASSTSGLSEPVNTLAYTTVTDPHQLVNWTGDRYLMTGLRSMDLYYFRVPTTGFYANDNNQYQSSSMDRDRLDSQNGMGAPGSYQTGTDRAGTGTAHHGMSSTGGQSYTVIRHQPGFAR